MPATNVSELSNGFRVASEDHGGDVATVGVWIDVGSASETPKNNGVAHFLEHMAFKGTTNRTGEQLARAIENMGGKLNAYTSREHTCYFASVLKKDVNQAVEILADILQNSTLDAAHVEAERSVILAEMADVESRPEEVIFDQLTQTAFPNDSLGYTILGPKANINSISRDDLQQYISEHYTPSRMVLVGAGAVSHSELTDAADKYFGKMQKSENTTTNNSSVMYVGSDVKIDQPAMRKINLAVAMEAPSVNSPDSVVMSVCQHILGTWDHSSTGARHLGSYLAQAFSAHHLGQSFMTFYTPYKQSGLFGVYAVSEPGHHVDDMVYAIENEWVRLTQSVSAGELARAKAQLKANMLMELDGSFPIAESIGRQMITLGSRVPVAEYFARVDAVTENDVKRVASTYFYDQDPVMAAVGPHLEEVPEYSRLRRWTYWLRA